MQYDLYILVYFDGGHPKFFCLAPPLYEKSKAHRTQRKNEINIIKQTKEE